jgi:aminoglycoside 6'-N-acetyltransferase
MPEPSLDIELAPVRPRDLELIRGWVRRPHVTRWWGDPDQSYADVSQHPPADQALISLDGRPVGYVLWQRPSREELATAGLATLPPDHVDVDILIGEPELIGRGIGPSALLLLLDRLRSKGVSSVGLGTDIANQRARRAFEKAGFRFFNEFAEDGRAMCYLIRELGTAV